LAALIARTEAELTTALAAQRNAQQGATHEESRPENDKDTRAVESSYLARGQAVRVVGLETSLATLSAFTPRDYPPGSTVGLGALVSVSDAQGTAHYFLVPAAGGGEVCADEVRVKPVTLQTPVGRALVGKQLGDEFELKTPGGLKEWCIESIS
jgi:transcription elongation GreA/GreB family factor